MARGIIILGVLIFLQTVSIAQLQSPDQFLGYKPGTRFTPHWKIVSYFQHAAAHAGSMMKLQSYGETNEGRPLYVAFISSPDNINNLENIRRNNLRLANQSNDGTPEIANAPAIVWLSYNVHGNESSSSEASMMTLYSLLDPANARTKGWLRNTVVIIDPCLNPDGRDRYVNWYNSVVGKKMNPDRVTREHREPWPGGRYNHYYFDLNRDWAWQTQVESEQRIRIYNQWLPHVHVDYHEQGINEPYYFAPAAEPLHEVITPWQRDFQVTIGKNNAKYFDEQGWLFFTKEYFDLFYPSYGDTYPILNGSIGMTYEQGGSSEGGLGVVTDEGDTLTLLDRVNHHFSTSMSTIEVSSQHANKMVNEFRKFFTDAVQQGVGEYKTYIIKYGNGNGQRVQALMKLLEKNNIRYGTGTGSARGYNYFTGKEEHFTFNSPDIIIPSQQPRSALVKVMFEPKSKLIDSATYDISAWSLPYAYGLNAYASRERINIANAIDVGIRPIPGTNYGYVMHWDGVKSAKTAGQLLQKGFLLRYSEQPFELSGNKFNRGSIIILRTSNRSVGQDNWKTVREIADKNGVQIFPVSTGFVDKGPDFGSDKVRPFKAPKIALLTGEGVNPIATGEIWHFMEKELDYPVSLINANDYSRVNWNEYQVIILPSGNYRFLSDKAQADELKSWVNKGGRLIALKEAVSQLARADFGIKSKKPAEPKDTSDYQSLKIFENRERDAITESTPGSIWKVELDNTHPLAFGYPSHYFTLKTDENIYEFIKAGGWNVGVIKKSAQVAGFVGAQLQPRMQDGLIFGVQNIGNGTVTYLGDDVLFRNFWENGKLMFCNALFLVGN